MNKIFTRFTSSVYVFFLFVLKEVFILNAYTTKKINLDELNNMEKVLIVQGIQTPVTTSWQLFLILLSGENYGLSLNQNINEFIESRGQIEKNIKNSFMFHLHPAMQISSSVLVHPRTEFLDFLFTFIDTIKFIGESNYTQIPLLINGKRNLVACNNMVKKMVKDGLVLANSDYKATQQDQTGIIGNSEKAKKKNFDHLTKNFCKAYLAKTSELFVKQANIKKNIFKNLHSKLLIYNKICQLLESNKIN